MVKISKDNMFLVDKRKLSSSKGRTVKIYEVPKEYVKCVCLTLKAGSSKYEEKQERNLLKLNTKNQKKLRKEKKNKNLNYCETQANFEAYTIYESMRDCYFEYQFSTITLLTGFIDDVVLARALEKTPTLDIFWSMVRKKYGRIDLASAINIEVYSTYYHELFIANIPRLGFADTQMFGNIATVGLNEETLDRFDGFSDLLDRLVMKMEKGIDVNVNFDLTKCIKSVALPIACSIACMLALNGNKKLLLGLIALGPLLLIDHALVRERVTLIFRQIAHADTETQSISQATFTRVAEVVFLLFSCSMFDASSLKSKFSSFMKIGQAKSKGFSAMTDVALATVGLFEDVVNFVRCEILGRDKVNFVERGCDEVVMWMTDIDKIVDEFENDNLTINLNSFDRVSMLKNIGNRIIKDTAKEELKNLKFSITVYLKKLAKIDAEFQKAAIFKSGLRRKPLTVCLVGKSGVGKSAATIPLINSLMVRILDVDALDHYGRNNMDFIYSRNFETKFWDGYRGHKVCVFDDFLQSVENPSDPDGESMNIIRASNLFPYKLHMAHLEDKGHSYFSSSVIFCTTNIFGLQTTQIKEQEALQRRFDIYCEIYPRLEFCVNKDVSDLKQRRLRPMKNSVFNKEVYEFHLKDEAQKVLSYSEFEDYLERKYRVVVEGSENYLQAVSSDLQEMIAARKSKEVPAFFDAVETQMNWRLYFNLKKVGHGVSVNDCQRAENLLKVFLNIFGKDFHKVCKKDKKLYDEMILDCLSYNESTPMSFFFNWNKQIASKCGNSRNVNLSMFIAEFEHGNYVKTIPQMNTNIGETYHTFIDFLDEVEKAAEDPYHRVKLQKTPELPEISEVEAVEALSVSIPESKVSNIIASVKNFALELKCSFGAHLDAYPLLKYCTYVLPVIGASLSLWYMFSETKENKTVNITQKGVEMLRPDFQSQEFGRVAKTRIQQPSSASYQPSTQSGEFGRIAKTKISTRSSKSYQYSQQMMTMETTTRDEAESLITRNQYVMVGDGVRLGLVLAVGGDVMMANHHYYENLEIFLREGKMTEIKFVPLFSFMEGKLVGQVALVKNILKFKPIINDADNDLWFFRVKGMRPHRHIEKKFVSQKTIDDYYAVGVPITLFLQRENVEAVTRLAQRSSNKIDLKTPVSNVKYCDYLMYGANTMAGDCGSLILLNCEMVQGGRLMGIHSSLTREGGFCIGVVVTEERVKLALDRLQAEGVVPQGCFVNNDDLAYGLPQVGYFPDAPHVARKTKLRPSPLHGKLDLVTRSPAVLEPVGDLDPYTLCIEKYACDNRQVDEVVLENAASHYLLRLIRVSDGFDKTLLSFDEACVGIKGEPFLNAVPRNTSAGYPWCNYGVAKWEFFGREDEYSLTSKACCDLRERVVGCVSSLEKGERPLFLFMDCMKDELRSAEKVEKLKTRMINACPLDLTILIKMYFGRFSDFMMKTRIHNGCAVGINAVSSEWDHLARLLCSKGENMVAGDFGSFDSTQYSMVLIEICNMINKWYNDGELNSKVRLLLWHEVWNSVHLHGKKAVILDHCLSTGNPLTVIINSIYVQILIRMGWISSHGNNVSSLDIFDENCYAVSYGDDHVMGISDDSIDFFNYHSMIKEMNRMGLVYTDEEKSSNPPVSKTLRECAFLKRGFVLNDGSGKFEGPLSWETIRDMPCWYRKGPNVHERIMVNCVNSLREASLHPRESFETHIREIREAILPLRLPSDSWEYYRSSLSMQWIDEEEETSSDGKRSLVTSDEHSSHQ